MTLHRFPARMSVTVLFACAGAAWLSAAKPPKPVTSVPATAEFRCDYPVGTISPCEAPNLEVDVVDPLADHIVDDRGGTYDGVLGTRFFLRITGTGRAIRLFLGGALPSSPSRDECIAAGVLAACNDDERLTSLNGRGFDLTDVEVSIALLDSAEPYAEVAGGLVAMGCGTTGLALVHYTAWLPGGDGHWGLNFNPRAYHSTGAAVTREGNRTWVVEAFSANDVENYAELVSFNHSGIRRKAGPSHEGRYSVPFQLTITVDESVALPSGSVPCNN